MYRLAMVIVGLLAIQTEASSQSLEAVAGSEGGSADVEFLRQLVPASGLTVFGKSRAKVNYDNEAELFSALYLNYTSRARVGPTVTTKVQNGESSADLGVHLFYGSKSLSLFSLVSIETKAELGLSWFSVLRYQREIAKEWKAYAAGESFSLWRKADGHMASIQRLRLGIERQGWAAGAALDTKLAGRSWDASYSPAIFVRRNL